MLCNLKMQPRPGASCVTPGCISPVELQQTERVGEGDDATGQEAALVGMKLHKHPGAGGRTKPSEPQTTTPDRQTVIIVAGHMIRCA